MDSLVSGGAPAQGELSGCGCREFLDSLDDLEREMTATGEVDLPEEFEEAEFRSNFLSSLRDKGEYENLIRVSELLISTFGSLGDFDFFDGASKGVLEILRGKKNAKKWNNLRSYLQDVGKMRFMELLRTAEYPSSKKDAQDAFLVLETCFVLYEPEMVPDDVVMEHFGPDLPRKLVSAMSVLKYTGRVLSKDTPFNTKLFAVLVDITRQEKSIFYKAWKTEALRAFLLFKILEMFPMHFDNSNRSSVSVPVGLKKILSKRKGGFDQGFRRRFWKNKKLTEVIVNLAMSGVGGDMLLPLLRGEIDAYKETFLVRILEVGSSVSDRKSYEEFLSEIVRAILSDGESGARVLREISKANQSYGGQVLSAVLLVAPKDPGLQGEIRRYLEMSGISYGEAKTDSEVQLYFATRIGDLAKGSATLEELIRGIQGVEHKILFLKNILEYKRSLGALESVDEEYILDGLANMFWLPNGEDIEIPELRKYLDEVSALSVDEKTEKAKRLNEKKYCRLLALLFINAASQSPREIIEFFSRLETEGLLKKGKTALRLFGMAITHPKYRDEYKVFAETIGISPQTHFLYDLPLIPVGYFEALDILNDFYARIVSRLPGAIRPEQQEHYREFVIMSNRLNEERFMRDPSEMMDLIREGKDSLLNGKFLTTTLRDAIRGVKPGEKNLSAMIIVEISKTEELKDLADAFYLLICRKIMDISLKTSDPGYGDTTFAKGMYFVLEGMKRSFPYPGEILACSYAVNRLGTSLDALFPPNGRVSDAYIGYLRPTIKKGLVETPESLCGPRKVDYGEEGLPMPKITDIKIFENFISRGSLKIMQYRLERDYFHTPDMLDYAALSWLGEADTEVYDKVLWEELECFAMDNLVHAMVDVDDEPSGGSVGHLKLVGTKIFDMWVNGAYKGSLVDKIWDIHPKSSREDVLLAVMAFVNRNARAILHIINVVVSSEPANRVLEADLGYVLAPPEEEEEDSKGPIISDEEVDASIKGLVSIKDPTKFRKEVFKIYEGALDRPRAIGGLIAVLLDRMSLYRVGQRPYAEFFAIFDKMMLSDVEAADILDTLLIKDRDVAQKFLELSYAHIFVLPGFLKHALSSSEYDNNRISEISRRAIEWWLRGEDYERILEMKDVLDDIYDGRELSKMKVECERIEEMRSHESQKLRECILGNFNVVTKQWMLYRYIENPTEFLQNLARYAVDIASRRELPRIATIIEDIHKYEKVRVSFGARSELRIFLESIRKYARRLFIESPSDIPNASYKIVFLINALQEDAFEYDHGLAPEVSRIAFLMGGKIEWSAFSLLELLSHGDYVSSIVDDEEFSLTYRYVLGRLVQFLVSVLPAGGLELESAKHLYLGTLKLFLFLSHDHGEFVSLNGQWFLDLIPHEFNQLRKAVIAASPPGARFFDPMDPDALLGDEEFDTFWAKDYHACRYLGIRIREPQAFGEVVEVISGGYLIHTTIREKYEYLVNICILAKHPGSLFRLVYSVLSRILESGDRQDAEIVFSALFRTILGYGPTFWGGVALLKQLATKNESIVDMMETLGVADRFI